MDPEEEREDDPQEDLVQVHLLLVEATVRATRAAGALRDPEADILADLVDSIRLLSHALMERKAATWADAPMEDEKTKEAASVDEETPVEAPSAFDSFW